MRDECLLVLCCQLLWEQHDNWHNCILFMLPQSLSHFLKGQLPTYVMRRGVQEWHDPIMPSCDTFATTI